MKESERSKALVFNHHLVHLAGSELETLQVARMADQCGYDVTVGAFILGGPMLELLRRSGLKTVSVLTQEAGELGGTEFGLLWGHHAPVLDYLILQIGVEAERVVCRSLSPYEPLEAPPVYADRLSMFLVNSPETRDEAIRLGVPSGRVEVFPNSVGKEAFQTLQTPEKKLATLAVISNHVPKEVEEACSALEEKGVKTTIHGLGHQVVVVDEELLRRYDAVLTIGRTIQTGMALGIPVYCYDRFGGPGWIMPENLEQASYYNFSGRCYNRKLQPDELVQEILDGYPAARLEAETLREVARERFDFEKNFDNVLNAIGNRPPVDLPGIRREFALQKKFNHAYVRELVTRLMAQEELNKRRQGRR